MKLGIKSRRICPANSETEKFRSAGMVWSAQRYHAVTFSAAEGRFASAFHDDRSGNGAGTIRFGALKDLCKMHQVSGIGHCGGRDG